MWLMKNCGSTLSWSLTMTLGYHCPYETLHLLWKGIYFGMNPLRYEHHYLMPLFQAPTKAGWMYYQIGEHGKVILRTCFELDPQSWPESSIHVAMSKTMHL